MDEIRVCDAERFGIDFESAEYSYEIGAEDLNEVALEEDGHDN